MIKFGRKTSNGMKTIIARMNAKVKSDRLAT